MLTIKIKNFYFLLTNPSKYGILYIVKELILMLTLVLRISVGINVFILLFIIFCAIMSVITKRRKNCELSEKWGNIGFYTFWGWITGLFLIWGIGFMYICIMILDGQLQIK